MKKEMVFWKKFFFILLQVFIAGTLLPFLLLLWTILAGGDLFNESYFSRRILTSPLFDLPAVFYTWLSFFANLFIVLGMYLKEKWEKMRFFVYAGLFLQMTAIFLLLKIPAGIGLTLPAVLLGSFALYVSSKQDPRKKLFPGKKVTASPWERFALFIVLGINLLAVSFLYQEGVNFLLLHKYGLFMLLLPFAGIFLRTGKQLREYLVSTEVGFIFLGAVFGFIVAFMETIYVMDLAIIFLFLFLEYQLLLFLRGILPEIKNLSILFLALLLLVNGKVLPEVCDGSIVSLSVFVLYILGDNWERVVKKIRRKLDPERASLIRTTEKSFAVQAWSLGAFTLVCFGGRNCILPLLYLIFLLFCTAVLKIFISRKWGWQQEKGKKEEWKKAREYLPLLPESCVIFLFSVIQVWFGEKEFLPSAIAGGCCAACVWNFGIVISGKDARKLPYYASLYHAAASFGVLLFLLLMFWYMVPSSLAASAGMILLGCALTGEGAYIRSSEKEQKGFVLRKWTAYLCIALGGACMAFPPVSLVPPMWGLSAVCCGALAFFAVSVYFMIENQIQRSFKITG